MIGATVTTLSLYTVVRMIVMKYIKNLMVIYHSIRKPIWSNVSLSAYNGV